MRATQAEAGELRNMVREGLQNARSTHDSAAGEAQRKWKEEMSNLSDQLSHDLARVWKEHGLVLDELRQRLGACWEGMRESRVELGDVMQTLHHLVERSEIQHVVNQMLTRAAYANLNAYGGGSVGVPKHPLVSPRLGLPESATGRAAYSQPPHLPAQLQHNHRKCLKRGECTCAERLATTLGAGDPRLALERLFDRQLRLLMSVRHLWKQAEAARGELPHVPFLPPLPRVSGGGAAAAQVLAMKQQLRSSAPPGTVEGGEEDDGYGVGEYMDGGVVAGSGADEGGAMGAHGGYSLPARLSDL